MTIEGLKRRTRTLPRTVSSSHSHASSAANITSKNWWMGPRSTSWCALISWHNTDTVAC